MKLTRAFLGFCTAFLVVLSTSGGAFAVTVLPEPILKFSLGEVDGNADVALTGGIFHTQLDSDGATVGDQDTSINFVGLLDFIPDVTLPTASFTLAGVAVSGPALYLGGAIAQHTTGGTFNVYASDNSLLLSGVLDTGVINGSVGSSTGSFFNTTSATFTGGSLLAYVAPTPAGLSIAMSAVKNVLGQAGMAVNDTCANDPASCTLLDFDAAANGSIDGIPACVPEPASVALLMTASVLGAFARRRRV